VVAGLVRSGQGRSAAAGKRRDAGNDARPDQNAAVFVDPARVTGPASAFVTLSNDMGTLLATQAPLLADPVTNRDVIVAGTDNLIDATVALLERSARFGTPSSGWGFAYAWPGRAVADLLAQVQTLLTRWSATLADFDARIVAYDALPAATIDADRFKALRAAELLISTQPDPAPANPAALRATLDIKRNALYPALDHCATRFVAWFERLLLQPQNNDDAWIPPRLAYQFAASAPLPGGTEKVYVADEYAQGRLDWCSLDVDAGTAALDPVAGSEVTGLPPDAPQTLIPIPVSFSDMPKTRWWAFEDRKTNFGDIDASTTDLAKLLFMEFALVYANDWFVIPYTLPAGAIASIQTFVVSDVFGERFSHRCLRRRGCQLAALEHVYDRRRRQAGRRGRHGLVVAADLGKDS
jgi:hypothetical protein